MLVKELNRVGSFRFIGEFTAARWLEDGRVDPRPLTPSSAPAVEDAR